MIRVALVVAVCASLSACGKSVAEGSMKISPEGISGDVIFKVDVLEVFEFNHPEMRDTFWIHGDRAVICGTLDPMSNLAPGGFQGLAGRTITIDTIGGNPKQRKESSVGIPEFGKNCVSVGMIMFEKVEKIGDRYVVSGRLNYTLDTEKGQKRGNGEFKVKCKVSKAV